MNTWLSVLCPSNRPNDLNTWLDSLYEKCDQPESIEILLVTEEKPDDRHFLRNWGFVSSVKVNPGQFPINDLVHLAYKNSISQYVMLCGDDTICHTQGWDTIFKNELKKYPDKVVLVYPDDMIFGKELACYPVTSRLVMDKVPFPLPFKRYAVDDTIFNIVPPSRRIYMPNVIMEHLHLVDNGPGISVIRDGVTKYYPLDPEVMAVERPMYQAQESLRSRIRKELAERADILPINKVMIGVITAEYARKADFYDHFNQLVKPEGSLITFAHGQSPARNRNIIIRQALEMDCSHVLFVDDDVIIPPDGLTKLLAHDKDIVSGLYLMRNHPHYPIAFDFASVDGLCNHLVLDKYKGQNLIQIVAAGLGCCLIHTDVFRGMQAPWIRMGELESDMWCDDLGFFKRVREAGFDIFLDTTVLVGHQAAVVIWPIKSEDGTLKIGYDTAGKEVVRA